MNRLGWAGTRNRTRTRVRRVVAVGLSVLLLSVPIGLASHVAAHLHDADEFSECGFCVLNSHFVSEPAEAWDFEPADLVFSHFSNLSDFPPEAGPTVDGARGPPAISV